MKQLLWINVDASSGSINQSTREQRSIIQSQVQRGRPRKRKSKQAPIPDDSQTSPSPDVAAKPKELYDPAIRSISADMDPFDTTCVPFDITAKGLLRYFVHYYQPAVWPNVPFTTYGPYAFKTSITKILNTAVADDLMMFCLLTATSCRLQYVDCRTFASVAKRESQYTQKALEIMQVRITDGKDQACSQLEMFLQCIVFVMSGSSYRNDFAISKLHLKAALRLLEQKGGVMSVLNEHLRGQILMGDLFLACVNLEPCLCGDEYDPGPAAVLQLQPHELRDAPEYLVGKVLAESDSDVVPAFLKCMVERILETYHIRSRLNTTNMASARALQTSHWVTKRNMATRNQLLAFETCDHRIHALRTALIMWTLLTMNVTGRIKTVKIMASNLRKILEKTTLDEWADNHQIRFWILLVGFACSPENSDVSSWFSEQATCVWADQHVLFTDDYDATTTTEQLVVFQEGFLYHPPVQKRFAEQLATILDQPWQFVNLESPASRTIWSTSQSETMSEFGRSPASDFAKTSSTGDSRDSDDNT